MKVKAKKHLGQHFLKNPAVSERIAAAIQSGDQVKTVIEIGPGTGALTRPLRQLFPEKLLLMELDQESVVYQIAIEGMPKEKVLFTDFLKEDLKKWESPICITGNFPYNISTQIIFKILDFKDEVIEMVGMFQKEVAERICSTPGGKVNGILSVLTQAFYHCEYLFTVDPMEFDPPPKVKSGVMRMTLLPKPRIVSDPKKFKQVIKLAFNQRRKTMRNSLKSILPQDFTHDLLSQRPEELSVEEFDLLTGLLFETLGV